MFISEVKFKESISINNDRVFFDEKKEIVFIWRSNVWKSSLLNAIFQKKDLVKTSSTPWKTRTANLFLVNNKFYFTDLPGYWFAKLWKELNEQLDALISWYLEEKRANIKAVFVLIDSKIWIQESDINIYKYILEMELPVFFVLSKIDKINKNDLEKRKRELKEVFFWQNIFCVSSEKKIWINELDKFFRKLFEK